MIVQPDFLDHWKTNALAARIGRLEAITALLALWAHCQQRRAWQFQLTPLMLAGICRYPSENPGVLMDTLIELNLLEKTPEGVFIVHDWAETNAALVHNWTAGKQGGRPRKQPQGEPTENPRVNPRQTQGQPKGEPIREEKRREEEKPPVVPQGGRSELSSSSSDSTPPADPGGAGLRGKKKKGAGAAAVEIYGFYPRKVGRDAALRAIQKRLDEGLDPLTLMTVTRLYAEAVAKWPAEDRQFVPHAATWFNQARYDDDHSEWARGLPAEKKEGAAPARPKITEPDWDWRAVHLAKYGQPAPADQHWQYLPASIRFELRQHHEAKPQ